MEENTQKNKSLKGYQIIVIILALVLVGLSFMYFKQVSDLKEDFQLERQTLNESLDGLRRDYDEIQTTNDTINHHLAQERFKVDSLQQRLQKEVNYSRSRIREYEKELGTLRTVMRGFVQQIDSLNKLNTTLIAENIRARETISHERLRADMAEEKADELGTKIRKGAVIRARDISLVTLSKNDKVTTRASTAARMRVDFVLSGNELSQPGQRNVYVRITSPDGYIMSTDAGATFSFEDDRITYSATRQVDYQNQDLPVSLYYNGSDITAGKYKVAIYIDGYLAGSSEVILR